MGRSGGYGREEEEAGEGEGAGATAGYLFERPPRVAATAHRRKQQWRPGVRPGRPRRRRRVGAHARGEQYDFVLSPVIALVRFFTYGDDQGGCSSIIYYSKNGAV